MPEEQQVQNPQPAQPVSNPSVVQSQKGISWSKIIITVVIIAVVVGLIGGGLWYFVLNKSSEPIDQSPIKVSTQSAKKATPSAKTGGSFDDSLIYESKSFTDANGDGKKFILIKTSKDDTKAQLEGYITNKDLSKEGAVKVPVSSSSETVLFAVVSSTDDVVISASTGTGKKYIALYTHLTDSFDILLFDEDGEVLSKNVVDNAMMLLKDKCQCGFTLEDWKDQDELYVIANTASGDKYRITIDATTGKTVGAAIKV